MGLKEPSEDKSGSFKYGIMQLIMASRKGFCGMV